MKYYSEITKKMYDTEEELAQAEQKSQAKTDECKAAYEEYKEAVKGYNEAYAKAHDILNAARKNMLEKEKAYDAIRKDSAVPTNISKELSANLATLLEYILDV